jgi:hypothetical protein
MEGTRLIYSDRLVADDRNTCRLILPGLLDWIFSFLKEADAPFSLVGAGGAGDGSGSGVSQVRYYAPEEPNHWLFIGLRAGISMKILLDPTFTPGADPYRYNMGDNNEIIKPDEPKISLPYFGSMDVGNAAFTFAWMFPDNALFASPFGLQAEVLFNWDFSEHFNYMTLAFAGDLRTHLYRKGTAAITLLTGGYFALAPLKNDMLFKGTGWGLTGGINIGNKFGAGYLYIELRWMGDLFFGTYKDTFTERSGFQRHLAGLCLGYEFGIINKNKK